MSENPPRPRSQVVRRLRQSGALRLAIWLTFLFFMGCVVCGAVVTVSQTIAGVDAPKAVANGMRFADLPAHIMAPIVNVVIFVVAMVGILFLMAVLGESEDDN